jgi:hypothetical protein
MVSAFASKINPLNAELNPICHLLALLGGATIVVVSRLRVNCTPKSAADVVFHLWCRGMLRNELTSLIFSTNS